MKRLSNVLQSINVLNVALFVLCVTLFFILAYPLLTTEIKIDRPLPGKKFAGKEKKMTVDELLAILDDFIPAIHRASQPLLLAELKARSSRTKDIKDLAIKTGEVSASANMPTGLDYVEVSEKNLFHPERRMPTDKKGEQAVVRPDIIFYGAIITSEKRIAYIEDKKNPYSTPGRGKRQTTIAEGAMIGGYKVQEVNPESIVLVRGDDRMVVNLRDQKDRQPVEATINRQMPPGQMNMSVQPPRTAARPGAAPPPLPPRPVIKR